MRHSLVIAFVFSTLTGLSQTADYFAGNPEWRLNTHCAIPYPCIEVNDFAHYLNGDTLIQGVEYKKLYTRGELSYYDYYDPGVPHNCTGSAFYDNGPILLRQDGRKILKYAGSNSPEELVYDFDLQVGDTIHTSGHITIANIDTIEFAGTQRLRFELNGAASQYMVEGIGHDLGFLLQIAGGYFECGYEFTCFKQFEDTMYFQSQVGICDFSVDIKEAQIEVGNVYPNPCFDELTIELTNQLQELEIVACDINGRQIKLAYEKVDVLKYSIETSGLKSGVYVLKFKSEDDQVLTTKIQKK